MSDEQTEEDKPQYRYLGNELVYRVKKKGWLERVTDKQELEEARQQREAESLVR